MINGRKSDDITNTNSRDQSITAVISWTVTGWSMVVAVKVTCKVDVIKIRWEWSWWGNDNQDEPTTIEASLIINATSSWLPSPYYHLSYLSLITSTLYATIITIPSWPSFATSLWLLPVSPQSDTWCGGLLEKRISEGCTGRAWFILPALRNHCLPQNHHCIHHHNLHCQGQEERWQCPCICCYIYAGQLENS